MIIGHILQLGEIADGFHGEIVCKTLFFEFWWQSDRLLCCSVGDPGPAIYHLYIFPIISKEQKNK